MPQEIRALAFAEFTEPYTMDSDLSDLIAKQITEILASLPIQSLNGTFTSSRPI